jgi:uncharacterized protein YecT (DUF1311 family)
MTIKINHLVLINVLGVLLMGSPLPASAEPICSQIVPESWSPSLDSLVEALENSVKEDKQSSQQALNQVSQNLVDIRDTQLFIVYINLMQLFDKKERYSLFNEQERWLTQREKKARASVVSKGGSLAALEYSDAFLQITETRLAELKVRWQQHLSHDQLYFAQPK